MHEGVSPEQLEEFKQGCCIPGVEPYNSPMPAIRTAPLLGVGPGGWAVPAQMWPGLKVPPCNACLVCRSCNTLQAHLAMTSLQQAR